MVTYPYILKTSALKDFLKQAPTLGVPNKVDRSYLSSIGFRSSNERPIVPVLKFIGFLDRGGVPTEKYKDFRVGAKSKTVMASALKSAYSDLFRTYLDAYRKDKEALRDFFAGATTAGARVIEPTVSPSRRYVSLPTSGRHRLPRRPRSQYVPRSLNAHLKRDSR